MEKHERAALLRIVACSYPAASSMRAALNALADATAYGGHHGTAKAAKAIEHACAHLAAAAVAGETVSE